MTTKTIKTVLFASLIAAMILPFSTMDFADAEKNNTRAEMKQIHDKIKKADASEKKQLKAKYLLKNQELNDSIHKTPQRDYVSEWKAIDLVGMELSEQRFAANEERKLLKDSNKIKAKNAEIKDKDAKIKEIRSQIDKLQSEALELMKMDPVAEQNILEMVSALHDTYGDENSSNAFEMAGINYEQKKLVVELTTEFDENTNFENSSIAIAEAIRSLAGENNVIITIDNAKEVSCTNYLSTCTPRVGGVVIGRVGETAKAGSIGYKATYGTVTGYVTAAHVVDNSSNNRKMEQPNNAAQISDGTYYPFHTGRSAGDVSFQKTSVSINDDLYYSGNTKIDVASYSTSSSGHIGQFVYKMGAGSGLTWGYVQSHYSVSDVFTTNANAAQFDSGGPVYQITGYSGGQYTGKVFGHVTEDLNGALYQPTYKLINNYGIYPATT